MVVCIVGVVLMVMCVLFVYIVCYGLLCMFDDLCMYCVVNFFIGCNCCVFEWMFCLYGDIVVVKFVSSLFIDNLEVLLLCGFVGFGIVYVLWFVLQLSIDLGQLVELLFGVLVVLKLVLVLYLNCVYLFDKVCVFIDWLIELFV